MHIFDDLNAPLKKVVDELKARFREERDDALDKVWEELSDATQNALARLNIDADHLMSLRQPLSLVEQDPRFNFAPSPLELAASPGLSLTASLDSSLLIDVVRAGELDKYPDLATQPGRQLLVTEFSAGVQAGVQFAHMIKLLRIGADLQASGRLTARVLYLNPAELPLYQALFQQASGALPLFAPELLATALATPAGGQASACLGFSLIHDRGYQFAGQIDVGYSWSMQGRRQPALAVDASVGASLSAQLAMQGRFRVLVRPAGNLLKIQLEQVKDQRRGLGVALDAGITVTGLDKIAGRYLSTVTEVTDPLAQQLQQALELWKDPGNWLFARLQDGIAARQPPEWVAALAKQLLAEQQDPALERWLAEQLDHRILARIQQRINPWQIAAGERGAQITAEILDLLAGIDEAMAEQFRDTVSGAVEKSLKQLDKQIVKQLEALKAKAQGKIEQVLAPLAQVREALDAMREALNSVEPIDKAVVAAEKWLGHYHKARQVLMQAMEQSARLQLGLTLYGETSSEQLDNSLLSFVLLQPEDPAGQAIYRRTLLGLPIAIEELRQLQQQGVIGELDGWLQQRLTRSQSIGFKLHFGGKTRLAMARDLTSIADARTDAAGNILVAGSHLTHQVMSHSFSEQRSVKFVSGYDILNAIRSGGRPNIGLSLAYADDDGMDLDELEDYLRPLTLDAMGLLDRDVYEATVNWYRQLLGERSPRIDGLPIKKQHSSRVDCHIALSPTDLDRILAYGKDTLRLQAIRLLHDRLFHAELQQQLARQREQLDLDLEQTMQHFVSEFEQVAPSGPQAQLQADKQRVQQALTAASQLSELPGMFVALRDRISAMDVAEEVEQLTDVIEDFNEEVQQVMSNWLAVRGMVSGLFSEKLPVKMLVFLVLLARICNRGRPLLVPTVTYVSEGKEHIRLMTPFAS